MLTSHNRVEVWWNCDLAGVGNAQPRPQGYGPCELTSALPHNFEQVIGIEPTSSAWRASCASDANWCVLYSWNNGCILNTIHFLPSCPTLFGGLIRMRADALTVVLYLQMTFYSQYPRRSNRANLRFGLRIWLSSGIAASSFPARFGLKYNLAKSLFTELREPYWWS